MLSTDSPEICSLALPMYSPLSFSGLELAIAGGTVGLYADVASLALIGYDTSYVHSSYLVLYL